MEGEGGEGGVWKGRNSTRVGRRGRGEVGRGWRGGILQELGVDEGGRSGEGGGEEYNTIGEMKGR